MKIKFLILILWQVTTGIAQPRMQVSIKGPFQVGFKTYFEWDDTRIFHQEKDVFKTKMGLKTARPIRISVWYPAKSSVKPTMEYGDYLSINSPDSNWRYIQNALQNYDRWATFNWTNGSDSSSAIILKSKMRSIMNLQELNQKFPVIIHFIGLNSRRIENIPIWEALASNGYIVVTVPQLAANDIIWELSTDEFDRETHIRDMEFALSFISKKMKSADVNNLGIIGYSFGSVYAMRFAATNHNVKAIVTYDATLNIGLGKKFMASDFYDPSVASSWLNLYGGHSDQLDFTFFDSLTSSDRFRVKIPKATHGDFEDFALATFLLPEQTPAYHLKYRTPAEARDIYNFIAKKTLSFFDARLKFNQATLKSIDINFLRDEQNLVATDSLIHKPAKNIIRPFDIAQAISYTNPITAYENYMKGLSHSESRLTEQSLLNYSRYVKFGGRRLDLSRDILIFTLKLYPNSVEAVYKLGETYYEMHEYKLSKEKIQEVIKINPAHEPAKLLLPKVLKELN